MCTNSKLQRELMLLSPNIKVKAFVDGKLLRITGVHAKFCKNGKQLAVLSTVPHFQFCGITRLECNAYDCDNNDKKGCCLLTNTTNDATGNCVNYAVTKKLEERSL